MPETPPQDAVFRDAACFLQGRDALPDLLRVWRQRPGAASAGHLLVAEPGSPLLSAWRRQGGGTASVVLTPRAAGLLDKPFSPARIEQRLLHELAALPGPGALLIDMDWLLQAPSAMANGAVWGAVIARFFGAGMGSCLSVYHRRHLPERDLLAGLHAHAAVVSPDGCLLNPYQLPLELATNAGGTQAARMRLDHWLGGLHPALRAQPDAPQPVGPAGEAAAPLSGGESTAMFQQAGGWDDDAEVVGAASADRWKIRCFGSLRVYRHDGTPLRWQSDARPGKAGATRKVRSLFALLLMSGERGLAAAELVDALWPSAAAPDKALNRLHHTVNELRRLLLPDATGDALKARQHPYLLRQDARYFLRPPPNSWVDIEEFPQLCRQGGDLVRDGRLQEALLCFESALKLYTGDLFADLPAALTDGGRAEGWAGTAAWLRELVLKVHADCARIHRELGHPLQAAAHCQQLLQQDACSSFAHAELMRLHASQRRRDALERQWQRYRQALLAAGHPPAAPIPLMDLYVALMRDLGAVKTPTTAVR